MTKYNFNGGLGNSGPRFFKNLAKEMAQAEEMEIKEIDPNGDMVIATEEGVITSRITPEDSLYSADSPEQIQMRETTE